MRPVWHIYYGTRGTAGSYIDALVKASLKGGLKIKSFVSSRYTYDTPHCVKCFFPITDRSESRNKLIMLLRGIELILAYIYIAISALFIRPKIVIHLIDDLKVTYYLFIFFKMIHLPVYITCHDIQSQYYGMTSIRTKMMSQADKLLVHNKNAKITLVNKIGEKAEHKINIYPFPFSSYDQIINKQRMQLTNKHIHEVMPADKPYYLALGVVRMSKGIETLLQAWKKSNLKHHAQLIVAGKWTDPPANIRNLADTEPSCTVIDKYISDEEYVSLIEHSAFVILPYLNYIHSAVLFSCGYHGGAVINSDIELFKETMPGYPLTFESGNETALAELLDSTIKMSTEEVKKYRTMTRLAIEKQQDGLTEQLQAVYNEN